MIAETPSGAFEIPQYALWMLAGWVLSCLFSGWCGYRWGLRAQIEGEKLKARNIVFAVIDRIFADIPNYGTELRGLFSVTMEDLTVATINFSSQLTVGKRLKIEKTLKEYKALDISWYQSPTSSYFDAKKVEEEQRAFPQALKKLRDEIRRA